MTDFRTIAFFVADHAVAADGKLFVNGGFWTRLNFPEYPQVLPLTSLVAVIEIPFRHYHEDHHFEIGIEDSDGRPLPFKAEGQFRVGATAEMEYGDPTLMPITIPIANLLIERPGDYAFTLRIDKRSKGRYQFRAVQIAAPMQFQLPDSEAPNEPTDE